MDFGRDDRVLKVIRVAVALATEIEPGLRVLMYEEWRKRANETQSLVLESDALPGIPDLRTQRISRGAETEQVHHHHFVVVVPAIRQEAAFGQPAVREQGCVLGKPGPLDAIADAVRKQGNIGVAEMSSAGKNAAEQDGGVDR